MFFEFRVSDLWSKTQNRERPQGRRGTAGQPLFPDQWLMFFRAVVVTLLLGATVIVQLRDSTFFRYVSPVYFMSSSGLLTP